VLRREPGALYAFPQQTLYSVGIASVALGIARGMPRRLHRAGLGKTPRGAGRLADNAVIQAEVARAEARLGAARCYLLDTVTGVGGCRRLCRERLAATFRCRTRHLRPEVVAACHLQNRVYEARLVRFRLRTLSS
jgi:alkylation response protein AidB-like acyl-CoA dehydrogenase